MCNFQITDDNGNILKEWNVEPFTGQFMPMTPINSNPCENCNVYKNKKPGEMLVCHCTIPYMNQITC